MKNKNSKTHRGGLFFQNSMSDERKALNKKYKAARVQAIKSISDLIEISIDRSLLKREMPEGEVEEEVEAKPTTPVKKPKEKKEKKEKAPKAEEEEDAGPVACDGNVVLGTPCPLEEGERKKTAATKEGGKLHPTCKACKKAIGKTRAEQRKAANPNAEAAAE